MSGYGVPANLPADFFDDNHFRQFSLFNRTRFVPDSGKRCVEQGRGIKGKGVGHSAVLDKIAKLPPHIILRHIGAGGVGTETDGNSLLQAFLCKRDDPVKNDLAVFFLLIGCVRDLPVKQRKRELPAKGWIPETPSAPGTVS